MHLLLLFCDFVAVISAAAAAADAFVIAVAVQYSVCFCLGLCPSWFFFLSLLLSRDAARVCLKECTKQDSLDKSIYHVAFFALSLLHKILLTLIDMK